MGVLVCPLCRGAVAANSSGCLPCHLPMRDVVRHQRSMPRRSSQVQGRLIALCLYAGLLAWCAYRLPSTLTFVVPGTALAALLHVWKGRPWLGLMVFAVVVFAVPALLWPSMLTDSLSDITGS